MFLLLLSHILNHIFLLQSIVQEYDLIYTVPVKIQSKNVWFKAQYFYRICTAVEILCGTQRAVVIPHIVLEERKKFVSISDTSFAEIYCCFELFLDHFDSKVTLHDCFQKYFLSVHILSVHSLLCSFFT